MLEATHPAAWLPKAASAWGQGDRFSEGWRHLSVLRHSGVPYRFGQAVVSVHGEERVERAIISRLEGDGRPVPGSKTEVQLDAVCISFGFIPNTELAQLAGAGLEFDPQRGGWAPRLDPALQTTVAGLFAAGETTAVAGAASAMLTGRLAGLAAAKHLGAISTSAFEREAATVAGRRRREARFGATLNTLFAPPPGLDEITTDATVICRCEEVTAGEVSAAIANAGKPVTLDSLKLWTRVGQGPCQGRTCAATLGRVIARRSGRPVADAGVFSVRPPVRPLPLTALAGLKGAPEDGSQ